MTTIGDKLAWLKAVTLWVHRFARQGGNLQSLEAAPLGIALLHAITDLARATGYRSWNPNAALHDINHNGTSHPVVPSEESSFE
jgi:hypothetical protein